MYISFIITGWLFLLNWDINHLEHLLVLLWRMPNLLSTYARPSCASTYPFYNYLGSYRPGLTVSCLRQEKKDNIKS